MARKGRPNLPTTGMPGKFYKAIRNGKKLVVYNKDFVQACYEYFDRDLTTMKTVKKSVKVKGEDGSEFFEDVEQEVEVTSEYPTLAGFAASIGICKDTLYEWAERHKEFGEALKFGRNKMEQLLIGNGINGRYNPTFAALAAHNIIGWKSRHDTDVTSGGEKIQGVVVLPALKE